MGIIRAPEKCHITDMPTENKPSPIDSVEYYTNFFNEKYYLSFPRAHRNSEKVERNKHILKGLIVNQKFPFEENKYFFDNNILEYIIDNALVPKTPKEKLENLLIFLYEIQEFEGSEINLKNQGSMDYLLTKLYFKNNDEYWFYLNTLEKGGLITFNDASSSDGHDAINIHLTFQGLEYIIDIQESGENSNYCFIAMSFSDKMKDLRDILKNTVKSVGYEPLLIDELNFESDVTINDAIIRYIKKSKFVIADFTEQKHGVYFEAGFALGLKRPVIYTCLKDDFEKTHFDTNHYPHIVYCSFEELEIKLKDKIKAWIE